MLLRILIVDDDPPACEQLQRLLEDEPDVEIIGVCGNARDALARVRRDEPDLVFVDVHLPGMDGFDFIKALPSSSAPLVVLVTADPQYAVAAFDAQAMDYLLKPFKQTRLNQTLRRARERTQLHRAAQRHAELSALQGRVTTPPALPDQISIKKNGRILLIRLDEIDWISAADNYVQLHLGPTTHLLLSTLTAFERWLAAGQFVRISRSTIVNLRRIREVLFHRHGDGTVILQNGAELSLSRSYRSRLDYAMGKVPSPKRLAKR